MAFNPKQEYIIIEDKIRLKDFHDYEDLYITRPPYQRKAVWSVKKQQALLDSIFRRYYVPKLVIREVRLGEDRTINEIIDGQQRITSIQNFFRNQFKLPSSLNDISKELGGKYFKDLAPEFRMFIDRNLSISGDIIKNIDNPSDPNHQKTATEIFWRLQQGESLNYMEIAHAQLSSIARNFVVKYSDDITFDFDSYKPVDSNRNKHRFFRLINRANDRMQHLALLTRFLIIEENADYPELKNSSIFEYIDKYIQEDGIGSDEYENYRAAKQCLSNLNRLTDIFSDDEMIKDGNGVVKELRREYFIISIYYLVKHLYAYYVIDDAEKRAIRNFTYKFYERWYRASNSDLDVMQFSNNRQQSGNNLRDRDLVLRQLFFEYLSENGLALKVKDTQRNFSEYQRIKIYRDQNGLCQECLREDKPERECRVGWKEYEADHVLPHSKGGETSVLNGQVLCKYHNRKKGNRFNFDSTEEE